MLGPACLAAELMHTSHNIAVFHMLSSGVQQAQQAAGKRGLAGPRKSRNGGGTGRVRWPCSSVHLCLACCTAGAPMVRHQPSAAGHHRGLLRREGRRRTRMTSTGRTRTSHMWTQSPRCQVCLPTPSSRLNVTAATALRPSCWRAFQAHI